MSNEAKRNLQVIRESYEWVSRVGRREIPLTRADLSRNFTDDVRMIVNNVVKADGVDGLHGRLQEMLETTSRWEAKILSPSLSEGDKVAAYCHYLFVDLEGRNGLVHTCSIWTLRGGRLSEIVEVAAFEDLRLDLGNHGAGAGRLAITS